MTETKEKQIIIEFGDISAKYHGKYSKISLKKNGEFSNIVAYTNSNPLETLHILYPLYNIRNFDGYNFSTQDGLEIKTMKPVAGICAEIGELITSIGFKDAIRKEELSNTEIRRTIRHLERSHSARKEIYDIMDILNEFIE